MEVVRSVFIVFTALSSSLGYEIHYAVKFGSIGGFTDSQGIVYEQEASSYNKEATSTKITGITEHDQKLYQSYSYASNMLYHIFDVKESGRYLLVIKMYSNYALRKYNLTLNEHHQAFTNLTVSDEVGLNAAYDEYVYFSVCDGQMLYKNQKSPIKNNKISVNIKEVNLGYKVCLSAMLVVRGDVENFPLLLNRQSKDAEISQLYQLAVHSCANKPKEVEIVSEQPKVVDIIHKQINRPQKLLNEPLTHPLGLNLFFSNFTFENMNIFPANGEAGKESDILGDSEKP